MFYVMVIHLGFTISIETWVRDVISNNKFIFIQLKDILFLNKNLLTMFTSDMASKLAMCRSIPM